MFRLESRVAGQQSRFVAGQSAPPQVHKSATEATDVILRGKETVEIPEGY